VLRLNRGCHIVAYKVSVVGDGYSVVEEEDDDCRKEENGEDRASARRAAG
jgi:hypothetical protein